MRKFRSRRCILVIHLVGAMTLTVTASAAKPVFSGAEVVEFESAPFTYPPTPFAIKRAQKLGIPVEPKTDPGIGLAGYLSKPSGEGPYPAVVLLHTCAGISEHEEAWANMLVDWGYVVLTVDSLKPRELEYICDGRSGSTAPWARALDAFGAKQYLSNREFVDPKRLAVMGMSHGGMSILEVIKQSTAEGLKTRPFGAAVALYPLCGEPETINTPTLVAIGGKDSWTPAEQCVQYLEKLPSPNELTLKVFPDAYHLFDHPDIDVVELGYTLRTDPDAAARVYRLVREFLDQWL